jgi:hypothetical protein
MEILDRVAGDSIHSIMVQARVHQIEYSSLAKSGIKEIMMNYLPDEAEFSKWQWSRLTARSIPVRQRLEAILK